LHSAVKFSFGMRPSGSREKFRLQAIEEEHFVCAFVLGHDGTARPGAANGTGHLLEI
jgi:hypothetical protein